MCGREGDAVWLYQIVWFSVLIGKVGFGGRRYGWFFQGLLGSGWWFGGGLLMQFPLCLLIEIKKKWVKFTVESYMIEKECDYLFKYTSGTVSVHN